MKQNRNRLLLAFCCLLAALLCACTVAQGAPGGGAAPAPASVSASASGPTSGTGVAGEAARKDYSEYDSFTGELTDMAMNQMWVTLDDKTLIHFVSMDADLSDMGDTRPGGRVTVYYTGSFNGKNEEGIEVVAVVTAE